VRSVRVGLGLGLELGSGLAAGLGLGLAAAAVVLAALALGLGLSLPACVVGVLVGLTAVGLLVRGLSRRGVGRLPPADRVTLLRTALVAGVAAMVADSFVRPVDVGVFVPIVAVALALDAVDGRVARRTGSASALGARFDMEIDALLILTLSVYAGGLVGYWVLMIGAARYLLLGATRLVPWLGAPTPPRYWAKVVAAVQGIVLTVVASDLLPRPVAATLAAIAFGLLVESFAHQVRWLVSRHGRPVVASRPELAGAGRGV